MTVYDVHYENSYSFWDCIIAEDMAHAEVLAKKAHKALRVRQIEVHSPNCLIEEKIPSDLVKEVNTLRYTIKTVMNKLDTFLGEDFCEDLDWGLVKSSWDDLDAVLNKEDNNE